MSQVAKMYLRGKLFTKTMKGLTPEQHQEIEDIIEIVMDDPLLQKCRHEFCNALARTIKNEYDDREVGLQDYRIAIMRAAVAAKYGKKPAEEALINPIQRKKWFQTWAFNYLRQILRENKISYIHIAERVLIPADTAALYQITRLLINIIKEERDVPHRRLLRSLLQRVEVIEQDDSYVFKFDHWSFPATIFDRLHKLTTEYLKYNVEITLIMDGILIKRLTEVLPEIKIIKRSEQNVRETSFDADSNEDDRRDQLEAQTMNQNNAALCEVEEQDLIKNLKDKIPSDTQAVLQIYFEETRPQDYNDKFGPGSPKIIHVAKYLDISTKEVKRHLSVLRHHCLSLGVGS